MPEPIKLRSEVLFLYDVTDANPNGDPDENKPRIDANSGLNFVTDVRLKRTIREYWKNFKGKRIFIDLDARNHDGTVMTGEQRYNDFKNLDDLMKECIDVRAFGALIPIKAELKKKKTTKESNEAETTGDDGEEVETAEKSRKFIGPVQFRIGRSLNKVNIVRVRQSAAFASGTGKHARSFGEKYLLNYSLVKFYGVMNEHNAVYTRFSENDAQDMFEAMWNGTKNLMTSSKFGHMPRLLLRVEYKEPEYFLGELDSFIRLRARDGKIDSEILSTRDYELVVEELVSNLKEVKDKIARVQISIDKRLALSEPLGESLQSAGIEVSPFFFAK